MADKEQQLLQRVYENIQGNPQDLQGLKERLNQIYTEIGNKVVAGEPIELGHPLTKEAQMIRSEIQRLMRTT
jgi:hypothetical protein